MYSENIDKVCRLCIYAKPAAGVETHVKCTLSGAYVKVGFVCQSYKYDVLKRRVRRKKDVAGLGFSANDFSIT